MKPFPYMAIVLSAVLCAACSEQERADDAPPASGKTRVTLLRQGAQAVSVYAFRRQGDAFLYDTLFRDGWTPEGTLAVRMRNGAYKFLFAAGEGENLALRPAPTVGATSWEEAAFTLRESTATPGEYLPADELFLQDPVADAERVYDVRGTDLTVRATLERAVSRICIHVKRGWHDGNAYVEVPYANPHTVIDEIERVELKAGHTGRSVRPAGSDGEAAVSATLATADYAELTDAGFVRLDGPFVIPPSEGDVALDLKVVPKAGSALKQSELHLTGTAARNRQLEVTLWITKGYPVVGVEIRTAPITDEQEGDSGIWH